MTGLFGAATPRLRRSASLRDTLAPSGVSDGAAHDVVGVLAVPVQR